MKAFILAAGKGERLLPYTKLLPKPLFPILGKPILQIHLENLLNLGIRTIGLNLYHLKTKIKEFLVEFDKGKLLDFWLSEETRLLGTAGGLLKAKEFFQTTTLIINSDILTNFPLDHLLHFHKKTKNQVTLLCSKNRIKNVQVDAQTFEVLSFRSKKSNFFYTGVQVVEPSVIKYLEGYSDLIEAYMAGIKRGLKIGAYLTDGYQFLDIGSINNYLLAHELILKKQFLMPEVFKPDGPFVIRSKPKPKCKVVFQDWVFIDEACSYEEPCLLKGVIAWKQARITAGIHERELIC